MVLEGREEQEEEAEVMEGSDEEAEAEGSGGGTPGRPAGLMERLARVFADGEEGEGADLLNREGGVLQWLQALDLQVMGACRADERLKPLLKFNLSAGVAEDRLLSHLNQHFEATEVVMLTRCLCIPLVSIRVGKVTKQGTILSPTAFRGHLNLTLLPSSDLCISFVGDDGCTERLALLNRNDDEIMAASVEMISADVSGRSFLIKLPRGQLSYFWRAERSKSHGSELLMKMNDLLKTRPTLSQLTGISEMRLECFAKHLRTYFLVSGSGTQSDLNSEFQSESGSTGATENFTSMAHVPPLFQSDDSQDPNFVDTGASLDCTNHRLSAKPRIGQESGGALNKHESLSNGYDSSSSSLHSVQSPSTLTDENGRFQDHKLCNLPAVSLVETLGSSALPSLGSLPFSLPSVQGSILGSSSLFSPYYCWCPPCSTTVQYTVSAPNLPTSLSDSLPLPPLSSLLSALSSSSSTAVSTKSTVDLDSLTLDFSAIIPEPFVQRPLPASSFITVSSAQQLPSFTPFIADPIVHIPVIDVCSSGQGYLVSAGSAISSTIPPLVSNLLNCPLASDPAEKGARETLRLLINSSQSAPPFVDMRLPAVFTSMDDNPLLPTTKPGVLVTGSRGLYSGVRDIVGNANGPSTVIATSLPGRASEKQRGRRPCPHSGKVNRSDAKDDEQDGNNDKAH